MNSGPVSFPDWKNVLNASALAPQNKVAYLREILAFLKYCKATRAAATNEVAKHYLAWRETQTDAPAREALRWFYRKGREGGTISTGPAGRNSPPGFHPAGSTPPPAPGEVSAMPRPPIRTSQPPPAGTDLGTVPWERELIREARERHFLWRTEQTYREWAVPAGGEDVAAFLSALAVQGLVEGAGVWGVGQDRSTQQTPSPKPRPLRLRP